MLPGSGRFEALVGDTDPAVRSEAADRCATLLVRGGRDTADEDVVARVVRLAETEGLDTLAELWAGAPADSLAGCLWRLYVAGVVDPPGPQEVRELADLVLRGVVQGDFADTLYRAAAFARVVAAGRAHLGSSHALSAYDSDLSASRLTTMAEQLEHAALLEREGHLA
jgi:hypothetical protein